MERSNAVRPGSSRRGRRRPMLDEDPTEFYGSSFGEEDVWGIDRLVADGLVEDPLGQDPLLVLTATPPDQDEHVLSNVEPRPIRKTKLYQVAGPGSPRTVCGLTPRVRKDLLGRYSASPARSLAGA